MTFEQQPRESDRAFAAFKTYLELGPDRSLVAVADKLGKNRSLLERWSKKFAWPARVQAHATHLAIIERRTAESLAVQAGTDWAARQDQHREDEWQTRGELIGLAREAIERWKKNPARCGTLEGIARLLDLASKLGRVSSGLSLEPAEKPPEEDAAFMIQIEVALEKIYGQAAPAPTLPPAAVVDVEAKPVEPSPVPSGHPLPSDGRGNPALPAQT